MTTPKVTADLHEVDRRELRRAWDLWFAALGVEPLDHQLKILVLWGVVPPPVGNTERVSRLILKALGRQLGGPMSRSALRRSLSSRERTHFDRALALLVEAGRVQQEPTGRGGSPAYSSSISLWALDQAYGAPDRVLGSPNPSGG